MIHTLHVSITPKSIVLVALLQKTRKMLITKRIRGKISITPNACIKLYDFIKNICLNPSSVLNSLRCHGHKLYNVCNIRTNIYKLTQTNIVHGSLNSLIPYLHATACSHVSCHYMPNLFVPLQEYAQEYLHGCTVSMSVTKESLILTKKVIPQTMATIIYIICDDETTNAVSYVIPTINSLLRNYYFTFYNFALKNKCDLHTHESMSRNHELKLVKHNYFINLCEYLNLCDDNIAYVNYSHNKLTHVHYTYALMLTTLVPNILLKKQLITAPPNVVWELNCLLADTLNTKMRNVAFVLDIETNTVDINKPFWNPSNTEIIDRYVCELNSGHCVSQKLIKNKYKLTTSHINNITETDLCGENVDRDITAFQQDMQQLLQYCHMPKLIAHNGNKFDFPILEYHNVINKQSFVYVDSLPLIRMVYPARSYTLINIYNKLFKTHRQQTHRAKEDTELLREICIHLILV